MQLRELYPDAPTAQVARRLRRSAAATYARAHKLGLGKSLEYLASPAACRLRRGDHVGAPFRFRKGHVPASGGRVRPRTNGKGGLVDQCEKCDRVVTRKWIA